MTMSESVMRLIWLLLTRAPCLEELDKRLPGIPCTIWLAHRGAMHTPSMPAILAQAHSMSARHSHDDRPSPVSLFPKDRELSDGRNKGVLTHLKPAPTFFGHRSRLLEKPVDPKDSSEVSLDESPRHLIEAVYLMWLVKRCFGRS